MRNDAIFNPRSSILDLQSSQVQYSSRSANWISRAGRAELIVPKALRAGSGVRCGVSSAGAIELLGKLKLTKLKALKSSARNCARSRSAMGKYFSNERSTLL